MRHEKLIEYLGLPASTEAERMLLGQILVNPDIFPAMMDIVSAGDFSLERNRLIFAAMDALHRSGKAIDRITLYSHLSTAGKAEAAGGLSWISELDQDCPPVAHPESYAAIVSEKAFQRNAITTLSDAIKRMMAGESAAAVLAELSGIGKGAENGADSAVRLGEAITQIGLDRLVAPARGRAGSISLPWNSLWDTIPALEPGQLIIVAARPGIGKSAAAVQMALHAARQGNHVVLYSLEMGIEETIGRILAAESQVNLHAARCGYKLTPEDRRKLKEAAAELCTSDYPFYLDKHLVRTGPAISRATRRHAQKHPLHMIVIDYLQLAGSENQKINRNEQIAEITRSLKLLAKELEIVVVVLSQLSRDGDKAGRPPQLSDLRDSGAIEQDADKVIFLHQKNGGRDTDQPTCEVDFIVAKNRSGTLRARTLTFLRNYTKFVDGGNS